MEVLNHWIKKSNLVLKLIKKFRILDNSYDVSLNILGFIVGYDQKLDFLQLYYDKRLL